jgi:hypothetical protein
VVLACGGHTWAAQRVPQRCGINQPLQQLNEFNPRQPRVDSSEINQPGSEISQPGSEINRPGSEINRPPAQSIDSGKGLMENR